MSIFRKEVSKSTHFKTMKNRLVNILKKYPKQFLRRLGGSVDIMRRRKEIIIYEEVWLSQNEYQGTAFRQRYYGNQ
jgi:hypothetical protein